MVTLPSGSSASRVPGFKSPLRHQTSSYLKNFQHRYFRHLLTPALRLFGLDVRVAVPFWEAAKV
jgi:hypothetical protein